MQMGCCPSSPDEMSPRALPRTARVEVEPLVAQPTCPLKKCTTCTPRASPAIGAVGRDSVVTGGARAARDKWDSKANGEVGFFWKPASTITYAFLNGTKSEHRAVRAGWRTWRNTGMNLTIIELKRVDQAIIRIKFFNGGGSSSCVGTDALSVTDKKEPTMRFGWDITNEDQNPPGSSTVLHEIGHALGLLHEHQRDDARPMSKAQEDKYQADNGFNEADMKANFKRFPTNQMVASPLPDYKSIMLYPYDGVSFNTVLSETDKAFVVAQFAGENQKPDG